MAVLALVALGSLGVSPLAGASGGGACPPPITNGGRTEARIRNYCYKPTVIHVRPGATVKWINKDGAPHSVTGANRAWGSYKRLKLDEAVTYRFNRAGVYPYYCVLHLGMVGTVVVRDGKLPESLGRKEASEAVEKVTESNLTAASVDGPPIGAGGDDSSWALWGIVATTSIGIGAAAVTRRRNNRGARPDDLTR
jgi:plastocyanin